MSDFTIKPLKLLVFNSEKHLELIIDDVPHICICDRYGDRLIPCGPKQNRSHISPLMKSLLNPYPKPIFCNFETYKIPKI